MVKNSLNRPSPLLFVVALVVFLRRFGNGRRGLRHRLLRVKVLSFSRNFIIGMQIKVNLAQFNVDTGDADFHDLPQLENGVGEFAHDAEIIFIENPTIIPKVFKLNQSVDIKLPE